MNKTPILKLNNSDDVVIARTELLPEAGWNLKVWKHVTLFRQGTKLLFGIFLPAVPLNAMDR